MAILHAKLNLKLSAFAEFGTDFSCKIHSRSNFSESVDFQKKRRNFRIFKTKCQKFTLDLGRAFFVYNFL